MGCAACPPWPRDAAGGLAMASPCPVRLAVPGMEGPTWASALRPCQPPQMRPAPAKAKGRVNAVLGAGGHTGGRKGEQGHRKEGGKDRGR